MKTKKSAKVSVAKKIPKIMLLAGVGSFAMMLLRRKVTR